MFLLFSPLQQLFFLLLMPYIGLFSDPEIKSDKEYHEIVKRHISSPAYGYTNVYVKYAKKNRNVKKHEGKPDDVKNKLRDFVPSGGPYRIEPWRNVKIPNPLMLNERFRNPKFISRQSKWKKSNFPRKEVKEKTANILNTNYKHAYLKRKKYRIKKKIVSKSPSQKMKMKKKLNNNRCPKVEKKARTIKRILRRRKKM